MFIDKINKKIYVFNPWDENEPMYSWWKLEVHSTSYDLRNKHYRPLSPGRGEEWYPPPILLG